MTHNNQTALKPKRVTLKCPECGLIETVPNWFRHFENSPIERLCDNCEDQLNDPQ